MCDSIIHAQPKKNERIKQKNLLEERNWKKNQSERILKKHEQPNRKKPPCYKSKQNETISKSNKSFFFSLQEKRRTWNKLVAI